MSNLGKILVGVTAVFMLFMLCMALLGAAFLFITPVAISTTTVEGQPVEEFENHRDSGPAPSSDSAPAETVTIDRGFNLVAVLGEIVKLVALVAVIAGVLLFVWYRPRYGDTVEKHEASHY